MRIEKGFSLKIVSITVVIAFSMTTMLYGLDIPSKYDLRPHLMYSNDNNESRKGRAPTTFKLVKALLDKDDEGGKVNKYRFSISYFWRESLGSKQKEMTNNIIDLYNETYSLDITEATKKIS